VLHITAANISCQRGGVDVFSDLSFELKAGIFVALRGPNGAGKSSLLRLLAGLNEATAGKLSYSGEEAEIPLREQCHYIAHQDAIKSSLTVRENLSFWSQFFGASSMPRNIFDHFSLIELADVPAARLSAGQKRRLALTRLLLASRALWLLDEPTVGLDDRSMQSLMTLITKHRETGGIILASTHVDFSIKPNHTITLSAPAS
jgi:heme exporter protein A